jgi:hypothetical protein
LSRGLEPNPGTLGADERARWRLSPPGTCRYVYMHEYERGGVSEWRGGEGYESVRRRSANSG